MLIGLNHWSLRTSRAKGVLIKALRRHQASDLMLKLSARATLTRLFGAGALDEPEPSLDSDLGSNLEELTPELLPGICRESLQLASGAR